MSLPVGAQVRAALPYVRAVQAVHAFMTGQDPRTADARYTQLLKHLRAARERLAANPEMGRPARFFDGQLSAHSPTLARAKALSVAQGLPHLRELVLPPYVLLYAHDERRVMLLGLRHERQLSYRVG